MLDFGAKWVPDIVENYEVWRLVVPIFLSAGWIHYAFSFGESFPLLYYPLEHISWHCNSICTCAQRNHLTRGYFVHCPAHHHSACHIVCIFVETRIGWWRMAILYLSSGVAGYILSSIFVPEILGVGPTGNHHHTNIYNNIPGFVCLLVHLKHQLDDCSLHDM